MNNIDDGIEGEWGGYHGYHGQRSASLRSRSPVEETALYEQMKQLTLSYSSQNLIQTKKTLVTAGQFGPNSACSAINPGVLYRDNEFHLLCRSEPNETVWRGDFLAYQAEPLWCTFRSDLTLKESFFLKYSDFPSRSRPEDWRLFEYEGNLYANHSIYMLLDRQKWTVRSRPGISAIDLPNKTINLRWMLEPPFEATYEEKNWSFFVHEGKLMCLYSFQPYIILEIDLNRGTTQKVLEADLDYQWYDKGKFIGNSTNFVSWDRDRYILFVHDFLDPKYDQRNRTYMQYGISIDKKTLLPMNVIPQPLVMGGEESGRHPGVHYTSALVNREDGLYAFYGQGDSHTGVVVFNKDCLNELFDRYQLTLKNNTLIAKCKDFFNKLSGCLKHHLNSVLFYNIQNSN